MPLNNLKQELNAQRMQAAQSARERKRLEAQSARASREYEKGQIPALRYLQSLERHFWNCVEEFSRLANLKIAYTNRPLILRIFHFGPSAATLANPNLYVSFESGSWERNSIRLEVFLQEAIRFCAEYERRSHYSQGVSFPQETYVSVAENRRIDSLDVTAARKWIEESFEDYYRKLMAYLNKT